MVRNHVVSIAGLSACPRLTLACHRVVCPVAVVSQWASEIQKMAAGISVIEHHGQSRTKGDQIHIKRGDTLTLSCPVGIDPAALRRAHVVITSYNTVTSEHSAYLASAKDDRENSSGSEDSDELSKKLAAAKKRVSKSQKSALFGVKWWRVVLGLALCLSAENMG